jgi:hypothetical protein
MANGSGYLIKAAITVCTVLPFLILKNTRDNPLRLISTAALIAGIAFIVYAGGDWMPGLRFFIPLLPFLYYIAAAKARDHLLPKTMGRIRIAGFYCIILLVNLPMTFYFVKTESAVLREPPITNFFRHRQFPLWTKYSAVAKKISNTTDTNAVIALGEAGAIPFICERKIIDLFGLNDRHIARQRGIDQFSNRTDCDYITSRADYVLLSQTRIENGRIESQFRYAKDLLADSVFRKNYTLEWHDSMFFMFHRKNSNI